MPVPEDRVPHFWEKLAYGWGPGTEEDAIARAEENWLNKQQYAAELAAGHAPQEEQAGGGWQHYLEPDWLMQSPQALLRRTQGWADLQTADAIRKAQEEQMGIDTTDPDTPGIYKTYDEFVDAYYRGIDNPAHAGNTMYYFNIDAPEWTEAGYATDDENYTAPGKVGRRFFGGKREAYGDYKKSDIGGWHFSSMEEAYDKYQEVMQGAGWVSEASVVEDVETGGLTEEELLEYEISPHGYEKTDIYDPNALAKAIATARGGALEEGELGAFPAITPEDLRGQRTEHYQKDIERGRESLIDSLLGARTKAKAKGSGIAGYGARQRELEDIGETYQTGVENIYAGVDRDRAASLQDFYDTLGAYEDIGVPT